MAPVLCADNLFSTALYPSHTIAANEAATGHEAFRVGNGRRSNLDYWASTTTNTAAYITATCNRVRSANFFALDRGHNLAGKIIRLRVSNDAFSTYEEVLAITVPSASGVGDIDDGDGVRTEEGAWVKRFSLREGLAWRVYVDAMGASLVPQIVGIYLGLSMAPAIFDFPWSEEDDELIAQDMQTDAGWLGSSRVANRRGGTLGMRLETVLDYDTARWHVMGCFARRKPLWIVHDELQADRAVLAIRPATPIGFRLDRDWPKYRQAQIPWIEHEPLLI